MSQILRALLTALMAIGTASAHQVTQLYAEFEQASGHWDLTLYFDAGFALPEMRNDPSAPAPPRAWLLGLEADAHERLRGEAERYLQDALALQLDGKTIPWTARFPDWMTDPPDFPVLRNGGAYFRIAIRISQPPEGGTLSCSLTEGDFPSLVIAVGGNRFQTIRPGTSEPLAILPAPRPPTSSSPDWSGRKLLVLVPLSATAVLIALVIFRCNRRGP